MKQKIVLFFLILSANYNLAAQFKDFSFTRLNIDSTKPTRIFFTALWCSPCMAEYKKMNSILKSDTAFNNFVIFDNLGFKRETLSRIEPDYFDSLRSFIIPYRYYKMKGFIIVNASNGGLKKFIEDFQAHSVVHSDLRKFWFGDMLFLSQKGELTMQKSTN